MDNVLFPSSFEDDYLFRSLGPILSRPDIAITELVANAWDAGAETVNISIPDDVGQILAIEDDGEGMTEQEFLSRWMKLRYNRLRSQGSRVILSDRKQSRVAFGRNGIGRHGLLCFGNEYRVITCKDGKKSTFYIKTNVDQYPIAVVSKNQESTNKHGTRLEVVIEKNRPNPEDIARIISARFLHDPQFKISVNHKTLNLEDLTTCINPCSKEVDGIHLTLFFIDTQSSGRKSVFHGIAFWQGGRMVGEPGWCLGDETIMDGRTAQAKRYTIVVQSDEMGELVKEDWTGFKDDNRVVDIYAVVKEYVNSCFRSISDLTISTITNNFSNEIRNSLKQINPLARKHVGTIIKNVVETSPLVKQDTIEMIVNVFLNLQKAQNGSQLLEKLSQMSSDEFADLNDFLNKWTVTDAMNVLNEIDRRLAIIEAIRKLSLDSTTDELHILHPMIAESRWLFGPEYESSEYVFNRQMQTAVKAIFGDDSIKRVDINDKKRPDLVCIEESTIGITGLTDFSVENKMISIKKLLLIELKKGGFKIQRKERDQATGYIEDLLHSTSIGGNCSIIGYVVGAEVANNIELSSKVGDNGRLYVTTYSQLVDTAEKRMFGLRKIIADRYDDVPGMELYNQTRLSI